MDFCTGNPLAQVQLTLPGTGELTTGQAHSDEMVTSSTQIAPPSKSPTDEQVQHFVRQNTVGNVSLSGVRIVSLVIDGIERLCLAQISNTLLKEFSYNEIHNRRVALGITCVQCTPVQLEILRRAGAMPISSRRCGMITKREAERLVKSFLEDATPPKLPDNFSFNVKHQCGWGCKGSFVPSRYNSSRAKCIKCTYCNMFFSPNKFIFHYHRVPEAKYKHPDAANFNSWRRHINLDYDEENLDISHVWEDVKAMFNGGSRKRLGTISPGHEKVHQSTNVMSIPKRSRLEYPPESINMTKFPRMSYPYPVIPPMPGASTQNTCPTGFIPRVPHPAFPFAAPSLTEQPSFHQDPTKIPPNFVDFWKSKGSNPYYNPLGLLWAKNLGLYGDAALQYANVIDLSRQGNQKMPHIDEAHKYMSSDFFKMNGCIPNTVDPKLQMVLEHEKNQRNDVEKYMSAFRPVNKDGVFTLADYKQLRLSAGSDEREQEVMSPNTHSEPSDASGYDLIDEQVCPEPDETDINVTDIEHNDSSEGHDINKNHLQKEEKHTKIEENTTPQQALNMIQETSTNSVVNETVKKIAEIKTESSARIQTPLVVATQTKSDTYSSLNQGCDELSNIDYGDSNYEYIVESESENELQSELQKLIEERQKAEKEYQNLVDSFKINYSASETSSKDTMEQNIKEAHEALRHFSCKMMSLRNTIDYAKLGSMHE